MNVVETRAFVSQTHRKQHEVTASPYPRTTCFRPIRDHRRRLLSDTEGMRKETKNIRHEEYDDVDDEERLCRENARASHEPDPSRSPPSRPGTHRYLFAITFLIRIVMYTSRRVICIYYVVVRVVSIYTRVSSD